MSSFSDEYVPYAEDNISIMSEDMEKSGANTEIDLDEINDVLLKNLETDVFTIQNEVKQRDHEMQTLLDELEKKYYAEKDAEFTRVIEEYEDKLRVLREKADELEDSLKQERQQGEKYYSVVETLENENEKLRDENRKLQTEVFTLNDKIQRNVQVNTTHNSSGFIHNAPTSPIGTQPQNMFQFQKNGMLIGDKSRNGLVLDLGEDISTSDFDATGFLKAGDITQPGDEAWISKFEFIKEKLLNEQNRNKELEFMITTQKNIIETTNENVSKLKQENREFEAKIDKLHINVDSVSQSRIVERTKVDSTITFCELMDNCIFPRSELVEKITELPIMISKYLKGESDTLSFNKKQNTQSKLVAEGKKVRALLEEMEEKNEKSDKSYHSGRVADDLDDIRHGISNLTQFLSKAIPPNNQNNINISPERPNQAIKAGYDLAEEMANARKNNFKTSFYLTKALNNPTTTLLWNFPPPRQGSRNKSENRD